MKHLCKKSNLKPTDNFYKKKELHKNHPLTTH